MPLPQGNQEDDPPPPPIVDPTAAGNTNTIPTAITMDDLAQMLRQQMQIQQQQQQEIQRLSQALQAAQQDQQAAQQDRQAAQQDRQAAQQDRQDIRQQKQQMAQVISVLNTMSGGMAANQNAPNITGWPLANNNQAAATIPPPGTMNPGSTAPSSSTQQGNNAVIAPPVNNTGPASNAQPPQSNPPGNNPQTGGTSQFGSTDIRFTPVFGQPPVQPQLNSASSMQILAPGASSSTQQQQPSQQQLLPTASNNIDDANSGFNQPIPDTPQVQLPVVTLDDLPNTRGRGRSRSRGAGSIRAGSTYSRSPSTEAEDGDGYETNRERRETSCKGIFLKSFSIANKEQEFPIWIEQFEDAVNRGHNPHSQRRHYNYCLQWLPGSLETDAYAIWKECQYAKTDWILLKKELEEKFEDPAVRKEWRSNPKALMWKEDHESLQAFAAKVKRKVNTYDAEFADSEAGKAALYCTRFINGMPDDYIKHINLNMPTKNQKLEKALEICVRFQSYKKTTQQSQPEIGAASQDLTTPHRVTKSEMDIIRLGNRIKAIEESHTTPKPSQNNFQNQTQFRSSFSGHSPRPPFRSNFRRGRFQRSGRSFDRTDRLAARNQGQFKPKNPNRSSDKKVHFETTQQSSTNPTESDEEGLALMSEAESEGEELDDTVTEFLRVEQMDQNDRLLYFGALRDQLGSGN